ncbi:MAG: hypothetical protein LBO09_00405 [Candidatus Peribacteria bacterium]|jgi:hypothetical protein|nr:hypothetical protein [Candidatus Peribacteria bacterium]
MRGFDSKIERRLPELNDPIPSYSRYADDIAISFDQYTTKSVLEEKLETYFERIQQCGKEDLVLIQEHMDKIMQQFMQEKFIITDRSERKYLMEYIGKLKKLVHSLPLSDQLKYLFIGNLNTYGKKIGFSQWRIEEIKEEISKIITDEGRTLSPRKIRVWTPLTNADREINGIVFDKTGKRGLSTKKQSEYKRLLKDLLTCSL